MDKFSYRTISDSVDAKLTEKNSRFLAFATQVNSEIEIIDFLNKMKEEHPKASHHCYAYRLGVSGDLFRANDDGEPSGSAGRPILGQIDSFEITNVVIDVVRYYGGVKLGVSGLIKAYKGAARMALENATIITKYLKSQLEVELPYAKVNDFQGWVNQQDIIIKKEDYGNTSATFLLEFDSKEEESIKKWVKNFTY